MEAKLSKRFQIVILAFIVVVLLLMTFYKWNQSEWFSHPVQKLKIKDSEGENINANDVTDEIIKLSRAADTGFYRLQMDKDKY